MSLANLDNLPAPDVLADDIIENLQSALESFTELRMQLRRETVSEQVVYDMINPKLEMVAEAPVVYGEDK